MEREPKAPRVEPMRLLPVRGLVALHNGASHAYDTGDVQRWLRLNRQRHRVSKVDLLDYHLDVRRITHALVHARDLDMECSLRTLASQPPPADLAELTREGLLDVFLDVDDARTPHLSGWLATCASLELPVRLQFPIARVADHRDVIANCIAHGAVRVVHLVLDDPLSPKRGRSADWSETSTAVWDLVESGRRHGVEVNVVGLPFCLAGDHTDCIQNSRQTALDHQHYHLGSLWWGQTFFRRSPSALHVALVIIQKQGTMLATPYEERLLQWILHRPWRTWALQLVRKPWRMGRARFGKPQLPTPENYERLAEERQRRMPARYVEPCRQCRLRRICDGPTQPFRATFPTSTIHAIPGDLVLDPMVYARAQAKYYDSIDTRRLPDPAADHARAHDALQRIANSPPDQVVSYQNYELRHGYFDRTGAGLRWFALTDAEYGTTTLPPVALPVTIAAEFSGGLAEYVGFGVGRWGRIVSYADGFKHEMILHVDANGHYVLLNNGSVVQPISVGHDTYRPERVPDVLETSLVAAGIELSMTTQDVRLWTGERARAANTTPVFSVLIVCNRYARRLQATLAGIAHQENLAPGAVEVLVAYTPHVDATDDVLDSIQAAFPALTIVRVPFDDSRQSMKGHQINEAARLASGEWIVLLDADIILPVGFLAALGATEPHVHFVAPDGRKMLDAATTAAILVGEVRPWEQWDAVMAGPGEWRRRESEGLPVGFCQCVRAACLREVPYVEVHGYEYADMKFATDIVARYGPEKWLDGMAVLHLDHGGSQWYGTHKHR